MTVYPQRRASEEDDMSEGVPTMSMSFHDVEKLQALYPNHQIELRDGDTLTIPELFPDWEIPVADLWSPVYEKGYVL